MEIISAIKTILDNISVKIVPCMNGLCFDNEKEYWIKIKDEEFEISEQSYLTLKEIYLSNRKPK